LPVDLGVLAIFVPRVVGRILDSAAAFDAREHYTSMLTVANREIVLDICCC
jgi:hypothetical protein